MTYKMLGINPFEVCGEKNSLRMAAPNTRQKWVFFNKNRKFNLLRIRKLDFPIWRGRIPLSPQNESKQQRISSLGLFFRIYCAKIAPKSNASFCSQKK